MSFMTCAFGFCVAANFKIYGFEKIKNDAFLTTVGSIAALCNGLLRIVWGIAYDKSFFLIYLFMEIGLDLNLSI